jgi:hypothetical protein
MPFELGVVQKLLSALVISTCKMLFFMHYDVILVTAFIIELFPTALYKAEEFFCSFCTRYDSIR